MIAQNETFGKTMPEDDTMPGTASLRAAGGPRFALALCLLALAAVPAKAADCPRPDALGTARTMIVDPASFPRVGLKSFPQTLPLADKEVVLTFDDGPFPATTNKILAALAAECVKATFFLIGRNAQANPQTVRAILAAGHSIGNHSWSHPNLSLIGHARAVEDIDRGLAAIEAIPGAPKPIRFFRFPYFASTPALLALLEQRHVAVFGADLWASDWNPMTPGQQLQLLTGRLENAGKGIILLHDPKRQTAEMVPPFLRYLKQNGYRIVHVVPPDTAAPPEAATASGFRPRSRKSHPAGKG